jgi:hypothetical protein
VQHSDYAVIAAVLGIGVYDVFAREGQTISEAVDRYLASHPRVTNFVLLSVYLHLCNRIPQVIDPVHWFFGVLRTAKKAFS